MKFDPKFEPFGQPPDNTERIARLERQVLRERMARIEAEAIAEKGLRDLYESKQRISLLQKITDIANKSNEVHTSLVSALAEICCTLGYDFGNAYLIEGAQQSACACEAWFAEDETDLALLVAASGNASFDRGKGLPGTVLETGRMVWTRDLDSIPGCTRAQQADACGMTSACAFPVRVETEIVAVLEFFARKPIVESPELTWAMQQIGTQLGRVVERQRAWALLQTARHDVLTGLPNRAILAERSAAAFAALPPDGKGLAMVVLDLNGFKAVNDRYGHHYGDQLLTLVATRLGRAVISWQENRIATVKTLLARTGGDEFVVMLQGLVDWPNLASLAEAIHECLSPPFRIGDQSVAVGASVGMATSDDGHDSYDRLLRDADLAMYEAKRLGASRTVSFTPELGLSVRRARELKQEVREAVAKKQFELYYQPIFSLDAEHTLCGFEALLRWNHPTRGVLGPDEFIDCAQDAGLMTALGTWVLRQACETIARMPPLAAARTPPFVSVNVAPEQFLQPNFADIVRGMVMETAISPSRLKIEITENVAIIDAQAAAEVLRTIRAFGVQASLDDFGTGYSSLSYLHNLPLDSLKIDKSFVASIHEPKSVNIIRAIVDLARDIDLVVIAEGIETKHQAQVLAGFGCKQGQGFLFGKPRPEWNVFGLTAA
ncbi:bifunctional diguanylate cyclase/phosphodiesterase [Croceicoccus bisphenolivorans]|uniref:bifunctional diguanylate cyclase/phosphodiesterase n=1 Tax=Croceicoccus bisphenolivorans TaxID=1783232 RepID=UPI00155F63F1|nr:bifunctional diguanylate cyclase/phosphodiesterase [Croceicoccus bisphenolivorans]